MNWENRLAELYEENPNEYFRLAKLPWQARNPQFLEAAVETLALSVGDHALPLFIWIMSRKYEAEGGLEVYPESVGLEDSVYRDARGRDVGSGPIGEALIEWSKTQDSAVRLLSSDEGRSKLTSIVSPVLKQNPRLEAILDLEDLGQEALLLVEEIKNKPWLVWNFDREIEPERIRPDVRLVRLVLGRLLAKRFDSNTNVARQIEPITDDGFAPLDPDAKDPLEEIEQRETLKEISEILLEILRALPPKQKEAVEVNYQAMEAGVSLEAMSRSLGRDPKKDRENFKAVQRKVKNR